MRRFLRAEDLRDEEEIREVTVPHKNLDLLWHPGPVSPDVARASSDPYATMDLKLYQGGDVVIFRDGKSFALDPDFFTEDRCLVALPDEYFFVLERIDGQWKVNADRIIEARRRPEREF